MKHIAICLFLVLTFRTFQFFPGISYIQETYFPLGMVVLIVALLHKRKRLAVAQSTFVKYVVTLVFVVPLWSAYAAFIEHGQPITYGLLASRGVGLLGGSVGLLYAVRSRLLSVADIEKAFMFLAWFTFVLYLSMRFFLDPRDYLEYGKGFVEDRGHEGFHFNLSMTFIIFGMFYYCLKAFRQRRFILYFPAVLFYVFVLGDLGGRIFTVSSFSAVAYLFFRWSDLRRRIQVVILGALSIGSILLVLSAVAPEATSERFDRFKDAFAVVLSGAEVEDPSANARGLQAVIALPLIQKNLWTGSGNVSYKWRDDSIAGVLGEYFYPTDIGLLGVLYLFGVLGTISFALQYVFARKYAQVNCSKQQQTFKDAVSGFLLFTAISSVATGYFCHYPEVTCTMIFCLIIINDSAPVRTVRGTRLAWQLPRITKRQLTFLSYH